MTRVSPVLGPGNGVLARGQLYLPNSTAITYSAADTYEKISGVWAGRGLRFFEADASGKLTYKGPDSMAVLFTGSSDIRASKICAVKYALFKNGALIPGAETPAAVELPLRTRNISITAIIELNAGDYLEVWSKISDATATLTAETLSITCWSDHR